MKAIITVGVSASGKTTWANEQKGFMVLSRDYFRRRILDCRHQMDTARIPGFLWRKWKWKGEKEVTELYNDLLKQYARSKQDIVLADTNLTAKYRDALIVKLKSYGYEVEIKEFPVTVEEAWKRDSGRQDGVGTSVIAKQMAQWEEYIGIKKYIPNPEIEKEAIICDIDGTLAHMVNRSPFDWARVGEDMVDKDVRLILDRLRTIFNVIILSGRDSVCREETIKWLSDNNVAYHKLLMRGKGDTRRDDIIKEEFFNEIKKEYNVRFVIDDRPQMLRKWNSLGVKVFSVGNPYIEF